jgi:hypothetical protein
MSTYPNVTEEFARIEIDPDSSRSTLIARSNRPFTDLSITVRPMEQDTPYAVKVYFGGEIIDDHDFGDVTEEIVCQMTYSNYTFPANTGINTIPNIGSVNAEGLSVLVEITNPNDTGRSFEIYACYKACDTASFALTRND